MSGHTHKTIAVLRGGPSTEYDVSMQTGAGVISALRELGYNVKDIMISRTGEWLVHGFAKQPHQALMGVDAVFIGLHGSYGEDGTVQRILSRLCIPYTGSEAYASALAMNKALTKDYIKKVSERISMVPHVKVHKDHASQLHRMVSTMHERFGPEYVVKPVSGGSSIGTRMASVENLHSVISSALEEHEEVLVEKRIRGKEATVGVLENFRNERIYALPAIEIVPPSEDFFSYDSKYNGQTQEVCPGCFSRDEKRALEEYAKEVHELLGLRHYSRSDFMVADDGIYFLEVNTLPGLTSESLFPKAMTAVGSSYKELIDHLVRSL